MMFRKIIATAAAIAMVSAPLPTSAQESKKASDAPGPRLTKAPKLSHFVEATYPESEKAEGRTASVVLEIAISETGAVTEVRVAESGGEAFDQAAVDAVRRFVFEPAEIDDVPAPVKLTYRYDFVLHEEAPKGPVINFEGVVLDRFTKKPLSGVTVTIEGIGEVTTDDEGRFTFEDVPSGTHSIQVSGPGFTPIHTEETIEEGKKIDVKYAIESEEDVPEGEESDYEIVVVAPKVHKEVVSTEIKAEEGRRVPGTQGDTLKVVQNMPGVARSSVGSGALVVWGAAPDDTRVYVDGVRIPRLYHGGGIRSTMSSELVRSIEISPGGYGSEYGRGLGGLVMVGTRALRADGVHGHVSADLIDGSAMIETPLGPSTRLAIAGRKSWLDRSLRLFTSRDVGDFVPIPSYWDAQLKVQHDLRQNETIELFALGSRDDIARRIDDPDPERRKSQESLDAFGRIIASYKRQLDGGAASAFVTASVGQDRSSQTSSFGTIPAELDVRSRVYGLRTGWSGRLSSWLTAQVGLDFEATESSVRRRGPMTLPARDGDPYVFGQPPGDRTNADDFSTTIATVAPYGELDMAFFDDRLHVVPGLRVEPYLMGGSRQTPVKGDTPAIGYLREELAIEPRISARYRVTERLGVKAATGVYHQAPRPEELSAVFGNPTLSISKATHWLAGGDYKLSESLDVEVTGFYVQSSELVVRNDAEMPQLARGLVQEGSGRSKGLQLLLRRQLTDGFFGWASYALIRSERKDHEGASWRLFDYDQTHVATVVGSYELGRGFEIGGRFRYATGSPRTPVLGAFYSSRRDLYEPYFGKPGSVRLPDFLQADVRIAKRFEWSWGKAEAYLDVQNVTNRKNPEEMHYSYDYSQRRYIHGLPILPVVGGRLEW